MNPRDYTPAMNLALDMLKKPNAPASVAVAFATACKTLGLEIPSRLVGASILQSLLGVLLTEYAGALERVVELLGSCDQRCACSHGYFHGERCTTCGLRLPGMKSITFGEALEQALREKGLRRPPLEIEWAVTSSAFQIIGSGRLPGAPDA